MNAQRFPERDIDRLFAGHDPVDGDLARLAPLVAALRREAAAATPSPERVDAIATTLASESRTDAALALHGKAKKVGARIGVRRRRVVTVSMVAAVAVVGMGGTAVAADSAAPGDPLYGIDQALERVGIGDGGTPERLREARRLADRGSTDAALGHVARALERNGEAEGASALDEAATAVAGEGSEHSQEVREAVSEMLEWMADEDGRGDEFGQGVRDRAREIRDKANSRGPENPDPETDGLDDEGDDAPGNSHGEPGNGNDRNGADRNDRKNDR
jgi:hypothetical protein